MPGALCVQCPQGQLPYLTQPDHHRIGPAEIADARRRVQAAARLCHIARAGFDGRVGRGRKNDRPNSLPVSSDTVVPGACAPIKNLYHVSQALVWIAQQGKNVETSQSRMNQIARLLRTLIDNESIDLGMID